jgi:Raf kinase inhibitor-like YbhB/YbcL family protein
MKTFALAAVLIGSQAHAMDLSSTGMANGAMLALAQVNTRCGGQNQSPSLTWSNAPANTRSFALTTFDPDAGGGHGFWHWLVFDIPATVHGLDVGAAPPGAVQGENDFGDHNYGGACPPAGSGLHHYVFTLYAIDSPGVPSGADANAKDAVAYLKSHTLATAQLTAVYQR